MNESKVAVASSQTGKTTEVKEGEQVQVTEKGSLEQAKIDPATAAKTNELSAVTKIKEQDLQKFQGILGDQQKLLDKASGTEKVKGMIEGNDNRIQQQKDQTREKVEGLRGQNDTKAQEMKAAQEAKVQENQQRIDQEKQEAQRKIEEAQKNSALEEARRKQEEINKNNAVEEAKKKQEEAFKKLPGF
jgi:antitoxin (DNA-binding transcriptional repressor) of toxin-antitoxin stability system